MANGRVATGYSFPYVALYANNAGTVTYTNVQPLARGVSVSVEPEYSEVDPFYADNIVAEEVAGQLTGGTITLTVDGLKTAATKLIYGIPEDETETAWINFDDNVAIPYVGIGYVARYMSGGVTSYVPYILTKCRFSYGTNEFNTAEDEIEWQTQELEATISRDDTANHVWKKEGIEYATEAEAVSAITDFFGGVVGG